jgi:flagellar FliL protein
MVIIVLLLLLLVGGGVGGAFLFMNARTPAAGAAPVAAAPAKSDQTPPAYSKLDTFVVNLSGPSGTLLQVDMEAELQGTNKNAAQTLTDYMPKIRSAVILLMSAKTPEELSTEAGKLKLKSQIKLVINGAVGSDPDDPVKSVLFTSFIIQNP